MNQDTVIVSNHSDSLNTVQFLQNQQSNQNPQRTDLNQKRKMNFQFDETIENQILRLKSFVGKKTWNGQISFKNFKGNFKSEYWGSFEKALRIFNVIKKITFKNTKLGKEHLSLLNSFIQIINPDDISLSFNWNEIDDEDLEQFLFGGFLSNFGRIINTFKVLSNPGIFKGHFLQKLEQKLHKMSESDPQFEFRFIKNKKYKSMGFIRVPKKPTDQSRDQILQFEKGLKQTQYYQLSLSNCFKKANHKAIQHLIDLSYQDDEHEQLERIESLDIGGCVLGSDVDFVKIGEKLSTSKGLLSLGLRGQEQLHNCQLMQSLLGDKQDHIRINHMDIRKNKGISEESIKFLAHNLIAKSLKTIQLDSCMGNLNKAVPDKIISFTAAFFKEIEDLKKIMEKGNFIPKLQMRKLDLYEIHNKNRPDLSKALIQSMVLNEFSSVKHLISQNSDVNDAASQLDALDSFDTYISRMKKINPLYANFVPKLTSMEMKIQSHQMEPDQMANLLRRFYFTKSSDLLQIKSLIFRGIKLEYLNEVRQGFLQFLGSLKHIQGKDEIQYTLENLTFDDFNQHVDEECDNILVLILQNIVFSQYFKLKSFNIDYQKTQVIKFYIKKDNIWMDILTYGENFLQQIPTGEYWCLKKISLQNIDGNLDILKLVELMVYNEKVQLEELILVNIKTIKQNQSSLKSLREKADKWQIPLTIQKLNLCGDSVGDQNIQSLVEILLTHPKSSIKEFQLQNFHIKRCLTTLQEQLLKYEQQGHKPMNRLQSLIFENICFLDLTEAQWEIFADTFIYGKYTDIQILEFRKTNITSALSRGLKKSLVKKQEYKQVDNGSVKKGFSSQTLIFQKCDFQDEIISLLYYAKQYSNLVLHFKECDNIDITLQLFKEAYETNYNLFSDQNISIEEIIFDGSTIESIQLLEWFLMEIILNKKSQKLEILSMANCNLKGSHFKILNQTIKQLKDHYSHEKQKGKFKLRRFNFDGNDDISYQNWRDFFNHLFQDNKDSVEKKDNELNEENKEAMILYDEQQNLLQNQLKDQLCLDVVKLLIDKRLSIPDKIFHNPKILNLTRPIKLQALELDVAFSGDNQEVKQRIYTRILKGLVYFPGSEVKQLCLKDVDLPMFLNSTEESFKSASRISNVEQISLKTLELNKIWNETERTMCHLAKLYISNLLINLESLILQKAEKGNFYQDLYESIDAAFNNGKKFDLKILKLKNINSSLSVDQNITFFKTVVFNRLLPLATLEIGTSLTQYTGENFQQLMQQHLITQNFNSSLKEVTLILDGQYSIETVKLILPIFIEGVLVKLDKFSISGCLQTNSPIKFFDTFCDEQKLINFTISELNLDYIQEFNLEEFKFFYHIKPKLKKLKLRQLTTGLQCSEKTYSNIDEFLLGQIDQQNPIKYRASGLLDLYPENTSGLDQLMKYFVFGQGFKWSDVNIKYSGLEELINNSFADCFEQKIDQQRNLRYLKIDLSQSFFALQSLPESGLKLLGDHCIYDELSSLEELCLISCRPKIEGLRALTSGAQTFREKIALSKQQQTTGLSLKRFCIFNTPFNLDEAALIINRDIIFFEYITIEKYELQKMDMNEEIIISLCQNAKAWLEFQKINERGRHHFYLKYADCGLNESVQSQEAWLLLCDTFLFTDNTPFLEVLNFQDLGLRDDQIKWICERADNYFRSKPQSYQYPLKRLSFAQNSSLSEQSWKNLSRSLFFCQQVELEELDLSNTKLQSQIQLDAVYLAGAKKASQKRNKKLVLHTLITYNTSLKQLFSGIMSHRPDSYQSMHYLQLEDELQRIPTSHKKGEIDETTDSMGQITSIITKTLYNSDHMINNQWIKAAQVRFSEYHLDLVSGFLKPLSQLFHQNKFYEGHFPIDLSACDELCTMFIYSLTGEFPYPYELFFTPQVCKFYLQPSCKIHEINFVKTDQKNTEQIDQFQVLKLWERVISDQTSLNVVYVDYKLDDNLVRLMIKKGYNERNIVQLIRFFPPTSLNLQDTLTLQALKGIYSIMFDNYQINCASMSYDKESFLNVGIGYSLRENVDDLNPKGLIGRCIKSISYHFFDLFVTEDQEYNFSDQIRKLNKFLSTKELWLFLLILYTFQFYGICMFVPYFFQHFFIGDESPELVCFQGITPIAIYSYFFYAAFSLIVEVYIYWQVCQVIPNHVLRIYEGDDKKKVVPLELKSNVISPSKTPFKSPPQSPSQQKVNSPSQPIQFEDQEELNLMNTPDDGLKAQDDCYKKDLQNGQIPVISPSYRQIGALMISSLFKSKTCQILVCVQDLSLSQLAKLNLYTEMNFILLTFYCRFKTLALIALFYTCTSLIFQSYDLFKFLLSKFIKTKNRGRLLSTKHINEFYDISNIGRNYALSSILERVAPYNVTMIPNNFITKAVIPQLVGKSMSNSVKAYIVKFAFNDVPHIIIQLYFIIYITYNPLVDPRMPHQQVVKGELSLALYITVINTAISIFMSFMKFMSIRPSTIQQTDFDCLVKQKSKEFLGKQITFIKQEQKILQVLTGIHIVEQNTIEQQEDEEGLLNI